VVFGLISLMTVISVAVLWSLIFKPSSNESFAAIFVGISAFISMLFGGLITQEALTSLYPSFVLVGYLILQTLGIRIFQVNFRRKIT